MSSKSEKITLHLLASTAEALRAIAAGAGKSLSAAADDLLRASLSLESEPHSPRGNHTGRPRVAAKPEHTCMDCRWCSEDGCESNSPAVGSSYRCWVARSCGSCMWQSNGMVSPGYIYPDKCRACEPTHKSKWQFSISQKNIDAKDCKERCYHD